MNPPPSDPLAQIQHLHQTYCQLTGQNLPLALRYERERLWLEFLRAGFTQNDLIRVIRYLQKQILQDRRHVGALKLSNLLQLDRFEEDLNISRVRLTAPSPPKTPRSLLPPTCSPAQQQHGRQRALEQLRRIKETLH